jgi:hypothetical protein
MTRSAAPILVETFSLHGLRAVRLRSPYLEAIVLPGKGADLHSFRCRATQTEMFAQEPRAAEIMAAFLDQGANGYGDCYVGGWPSLLPSRARSARTMLGPGDCGEAATVAWDAREIIVRGAVRLHCTADLPRSGLRVSRTFGFDLTGRRVIVRAGVTNIADVPIEFHWTEHPTFGGDLLAGDFELMTPACTVHDVESSHLPSAPSERVPMVGGSTADLRDLRLPAGGDLFRTLSAPAMSTIALFSATYGVGCCLRWDERQLPHAWYWQAHRDGRRMLAIEPSNSFGTELDDEAGAPPLRLDPGASMSTRLSLAVINATEAASLRRSLAPERATARTPSVRP